ncbi:hypothetical protein Clacol_004660 [Clathrus columnatus]|uniref:Nucleolar protein 10-like second domain-containing protein n=1 Tax=Clathrus columnatus TaxID=1419009 RepID=A0AAV5ACJ5_9AGAM|nr:hypothetical protein Clacol_004660 [Clathrus columnatus]
MEDQTGRSVYEDYRFVERTELDKLGLDHLVGTPALKPYMHDYTCYFKSIYSRTISEDGQREIGETTRNMYQDKKRCSQGQ